MPISLVSFTFNLGYPALVFFVLLASIMAKSSAKGAIRN